MNDIILKTAEESQCTDFIDQYYHFKDALMKEDVPSVVRSVIGDGVGLLVYNAVASAEGLTFRAIFRRLGRPQS